MDIKEDFDLKDFTTLHVGGRARYFVEIKNENELKEAVNFAEKNKIDFFVMGGGSNLVVSDNGFSGLVIRPMIKGVEIVGTDIDDVRVRVGAGEVLDDVIKWCVENGFWGVENLSWVPGLMGAFAVQNVGAYGQEASDVIETVEVFDRKSGEIKKLTKDDCKFRYRSSIFNKEERGRYIILYVDLLLNKFGDPNTSYIDVRKYFAKKGISKPSLVQMRNAIIEIRDKKGQNIGEYKTAGSFFSNLLLTEKEFEELNKKVLEVAGEKIANDLLDIKNKFFIAGELDPDGLPNKIKIPTGFLMDIVLNLKGTEHGGAVLSDKQVLNLLNTDNASASDIMELFRKVRNIMWKKLGVKIVNEPELLGFSREEIDYYFDLDN